MKGGDKQGRGRLLALQLESSPLFRRVSVVVVCFLFVLVFLYSSGHDGAVFDILGPPKTSLRTPAAAVGGVVREAGAEAASTLNSDDRRSAPPGAAAEAEESPVQDKAVHVTASSAAQPAMENTASPPGDTGTTTRADSVVERQPPPLCDLSSFRADVCDLAGDLRLDAKASTFFVVVTNPAAANGTTYRVRPYPRKGDKTAMARVTEVTVTAADAAPRCTATHAAPAVAFSVGGYAGNIFHDFSDVIVPLYGSARQYQGEVQLVVADAEASGRRWLARYGALLAGLSRHPPLDLAAAARAGEVHCFGRAVVGLLGGRELLIEPGRGPDGTSMPDLSRFLRAALALPRAAPTRSGSGVNKPRLLIISRLRTRKLLNVDAAARAAEEAGFGAVVTELGPADDVTQVGRLFNSFDAVVGVHGAALTNMVFLPPGAAVVQIVPWGGLRWIARLDFGDAAEAMGLRYVQYEVNVEETTLKDKYPRDHEIFTNPTALHKLGFKFMRHTLLNGQDIILDIERFRAVLRQVLNSLAH